MIASVLCEKYADLLDSDWKLTRSDVERDVAALFGGNFERFIA